MTRSRHNLKVISLASLLIIAICALVTFFVLRTANPYTNVESVQRQSQLSLVLPTPLPGDTKIVDQPTYDNRIHSIFTRLTVDGHEMTFSQQARPDTNLKQVDAQDTFLVPVGSVYVLKGESGRLQAIIETTDSWIMINADEKIGHTRFKELLNGLRAI